MRVCRHGGTATTAAAASVTRQSSCPGPVSLVVAFSERAWVAEQPELHLRPHVEAWCEGDQRLALKDTYTDDRHAYVLDLEWRGAPVGVGEARATVFSLIGSFAE